MHAWFGEWVRPKNTNTPKHDYQIKVRLCLIVLMYVASRGPSNLGRLGSTWTVWCEQLLVQFTNIFAFLGYVFDVLAAQNISARDKLHICCITAHGLLWSWYYASALGSNQNSRSYARAHSANWSCEGFQVWSRRVHKCGPDRFYSTSLTGVQRAWLRVLLRERVSESKSELYGLDDWLDSGTEVKETGFLPTVCSRPTSPGKFAVPI